MRGEINLFPAQNKHFILINYSHLIGKVIVVLPGSLGPNSQALISLINLVSVC